MATPRIDRLVDHLVGGAVRDPLALELSAWLAASPRFRRFVEAHRDKVRKKLRVAGDAEGRMDVRSELRVASLLLADRRIELAFEPGGAVRGGPDFIVSYRDHPAFFLEVTRLRRAADGAAIGRVLLAKLRQLPPSLPSALLIDVESEDASLVPLDAAVRSLRARADAADAALLSRGGFDGPRAFYHRFLRLAAILAVGGAGSAALWVNRSAELVAPEAALRACLAALRTGA